MRRSCAPSLCAVLVRRRFNARRSPLHSLPPLSLSYYFTISILLPYNLYPFSILSLSFNFLRLPPFIFAPFVAFCSFSIPVSKVAPVSRASACDFFCPSLCALPRPLAASPFLLLLSSPPFLSPPPPIPPCALAFLRQALRRPLLAKPPQCLGRQPVTRAQTTVYPPKNKEKRPLFKKKRENIWLFPEKCVPLHSLSRTGHLATRF